MRIRGGVSSHLPPAGGTRPPPPPAIGVRTNPGGGEGYPGLPKRSKFSFWQFTPKVFAIFYSQKVPQMTVFGRFLGWQNFGLVLRAGPKFSHPDTRHFLGGGRVPSPPTLLDRGVRPPPAPCLASGAPVVSMCCRTSLWRGVNMLWPLRERPRVSIPPKFEPPGSPEGQ